MDAIWQCLAKFYDSSSQQVSVDKTHIFFSHNVNHNVWVEYLGKYFGVPILHGKTSTYKDKNILDHASRRLSNWKASYLSLSGQLTLINSVL